MGGRRAGLAHHGLLLALALRVVALATTSTCVHAVAACDRGDDGSGGGGGDGGGGDDDGGSGGSDYDNGGNGNDDGGDDGGGDGGDDGNSNGNDKDGDSNKSKIWPYEYSRVCSKTPFSNLSKTEKTFLKKV